MFWLGLFNSSLFWYFIQQTGYVLRGGYYTFKTNYILPFPVPATIPSHVKFEVENTVKEILSLKKIDNNADISSHEKKVNNSIYQLYDISLQEIEIIENSKIK